MADNVLVCTAWPYASGPIHLGHLAGHLIPPDIYTRFRRMRGDRAILVSGSDEHGTPITIAAEAEGISPQDLVDRNHAQIVKAIEDMGIVFDMYVARAKATDPRSRIHERSRALRRSLERDGWWKVVAASLAIVILTAIVLSQIPG